MDTPFSLLLRLPIRLWLFLAGPTRSYIICECSCTCAITPHGPLHDLPRVQQSSLAMDVLEGVAANVPSKEDCGGADPDASQLNEAFHVRWSGLQQAGFATQRPSHP